MEKFMYKLIPIGVLVHFILFFGVMDIYFKSPIQQGLQQHKSLSEPPADRVVIIIADGLRAESLFAKENENRTPYLTYLRNNIAAWGISHTRVPTESRPGHVAIMAGIYEDPSAIMKGWKYNPVEFDSVINQSRNAWCFGSPDNVYLFNKGHSLHIRESAYPPEMQDFGEKQTYYLDEWVFKELNKLFKYRTLDKCGALCVRGNIFFLNLLGLDTAGHSFKPNSDEHTFNMNIVDKGVKNLVKLFESFYGDSNTAFIFTADHGMTDWGSHGDGSSFETETPFIGWGAGFKHNVIREDINQADIAPLIATLIGINIPTNSIGALPYKYLNLPLTDIAEALLNNIKQLMELYKSEEEKSSSAFFFQSYVGLENVPNLLRNLQQLYDEQEHLELIEKCDMVKDMIYRGLDYLQQYSSRPIFVCLSFAMVYWIVYLTMSIVQRDQRQHNYIYEPSKYQNYFKAVVYFVTFLSCSIFFRFPLMWSSYFYIALPLVVLKLIFHDVKYLVYLHKVFLLSNVKENLKYGAATIIMLEIFVLGFHYRYFFSFFMIIIAFWPYTKDWQYNVKADKIRWTLTCLLLSVFPTLPVMKTNFNFYCYLITFALWLSVMLSKFKYENVAPQNNMNRIIFTLLFRNQYVLYLFAAFDALYIALCFAQDKPVPYICRAISWLLLVACLMNLYLSPTYVIFRLVNISVSLMSVYTLFLFNFEGPFILCLMYLLYQWLGEEMFIKNGNRAIRLLFRLRFDMPLVVTPGAKYSYHDFRRAFFYLGFVLISFFGTGNIASLNSFDPMWVRNFTTVFSPFTMMVLILIKITVPILMVTCVFRAINLYLDMQISNAFSMIILFSDIMLFNFLFLIKNTGSWLEIGTSLSHFIIMDIISVILMFFYLLSYVFTTFSLYGQYVAYIERYNL